MAYEAQLLFTSVLLISLFLVYKLVEGGFLGSLSSKYYAWTGRAEERRKLELILNAEKRTIQFNGPPVETEKKQKFEDQVAKVPIDSATGEAIIEGPIFDSWLRDTRTALLERATETVVSFRNFNTYFFETYVKLGLGLASNRSFKDAEATRQAFDQEFNDIVDWAKKLKSGWENQIIPLASQMADNITRKQMEQARQAEQTAMNDTATRQQERIRAKIAAAEERYKSSNALGAPSASPPPTSSEDMDALAKEAESELLEEANRKEQQQKKKGKSKV